MDLYPLTSKQLHELAQHATSRRVTRAREKTAPRFPAARAAGHLAQVFTRPARAVKYEAPGRISGEPRRTVPPSLSSSSAHTREAQLFWSWRKTCGFPVFIETLRHRPISCAQRSHHVGWAAGLDFLHYFFRTRCKIRTFSNSGLKDYILISTDDELKIYTLY